VTDCQKSPTTTTVRSADIDLLRQGHGKTSHCRAIRGVIQSALAGAVFFVAAALASIAQAQGFDCSVSRVVDGDTFHCTSGIKVRIDGINAPEIDDTYGPVSQATLDGLIGGATVQCEPTGTTYDRIAAICYLNGRDIGAMMVERAMARDCARYSGGRYAGLEDERHGVLPIAGFCKA